MDKLLFHALIEKENGSYSALCLELDVASQGKTIQQAKKNLREAVELYLEDVFEANEEKDFIPRPAPRIEWIKYFKAEAKALSKRLKNHRHVQIKNYFCVGKQWDVRNSKIVKRVAVAVANWPLIERMERVIFLS